MFCSNCGKQIPDASRFCPECGTSVALDGPPPVPPVPPVQVVDASVGTRDQVKGPTVVYPQNPPLSPHLCWVNLVLSGLAQILHGQVAKGIVILIATIGSNLVLPILLAIVIGAISIIDAYMVGKTLRNGRPVGKWEWFPQA